MKFVSKENTDYSNFLNGVQKIIRSQDVAHINNLSAFQYSD